MGERTRWRREGVSRAGRQPPWLPRVSSHSCIAINMSAQSAIQKGKTKRVWRRPPSTPSDTLANIFPALIGLRLTVDLRDETTIQGTLARSENLKYVILNENWVFVCGVDCSTACTESVSSLTLTDVYYHSAQSQEAIEHIILLSIIVLICSRSSISK